MGRNNKLFHKDLKQQMYETLTSIQKKVLAEASQKTRRMVTQRITSIPIAPIKVTGSTPSTLPTILMSITLNALH